jgi:hypothetical protein
MVYIDSPFTEIESTHFFSLFSSYDVSTGYEPGAAEQVDKACFSKPSFIE